MFPQRVYHCSCVAFEVKLCCNNYVVFSCRQHMPLVTYCKMDCLKCIKTFLQTSYYWCYEYTNFDLPLYVKKEKKVLRLIVEKL